MSPRALKHLEDELLTNLCISSYGTADLPTLIFLLDAKDVKDDLVQDALERLVGSEEVERVGVAYRITDAGRKRLQGRSS